MNQFESFLNKSFDVPPRVSSTRTKSQIFSNAGDTESQTLTAEEKFFVLMAMHYGSREEYEKFLLVYQTISDEKLISKVNSAIKSPHKVWSSISSYCDMAATELKSLFEGNRGMDQTIHIRAAQRSLWNAGQPAVCIGLNPANIDAIKDMPEVCDTFADINNIIKGFESEKLDTIKNVLINIIACTQSDVRDRVQTRQDRIATVKDIVSHFVRGELPFKLSPDSYKVPKEPGVSLPHTLSPRDWLGTMVTALVEKEFSSSVLVAFRDGDINQVRQYRGNKYDYLLVSPNEDSAYSIFNTPAMYLHDRYDSDGLWEWRSTEQLIKKRVAFELSSQGLSGQQQAARDELRSIYELEAALEIKGGADSIDFVDDGYFGIIPDDMSKRIGKSYCLRFYSRGFSKPTEVKDNPGYLHICKTSIIPSLTPGEYYPITLSDLHTVVLFPMRLWNSSAYAISAAQNPMVKVYRSALGMKSIKSSMKNIQLFFTLFQLAHVFEMYKCWKGGKPYDPEAYTDEIEISLRSSKHKLFSQLFNPRKVDLTARAQIMDTFCPVALGPVQGIWLAPSTSSLGREGLNNIQADSAFSKELGMYELQDYESFGVNSGYDFGNNFMDIYSDSDHDDLDNENSIDESAGEDSPSHHGSGDDDFFDFSDESAQMIYE